MRLLAAGVVIVCLAVACKKREPEDFAPRCLEGDQQACVKACQAGVHGKGGCMTAGATRNFRRSAEMYARACRGNVAEACAKAAAASITMNLNQHRPYRELLERGCELRDAEACRRLGDHLLFDGMDQAEAAYRRACHPPAECEADFAKTLQALRRDQSGCDANDARACERLLHGLAARNHDAGYRAAERVCQLRGLTDHYAKSTMPFSFKLRKLTRHYGGCGLFLLARAASDPEQKSAFQRVALPAPAARGGRIELDSVDFHFRPAPTAQAEAQVAAKQLVEAAVRARFDLARGCYNQRPSTKPELAGGVTAHFSIDKLGEPLELRASGDVGDLALRQCLVSALVPERFDGVWDELQQVVQVELTAQLLPSTSKHAASPARATATK